MPESENESNEELKAKILARDAEFQSKLKTDATPDERQRRWTQFREIHSQRTSIKVIELYFKAIILPIVIPTRNRYVLAATASVIIVSLLILWNRLLIPDRLVTLNKRPNTDLSATISLPRILRMDLKNNGLELIEDLELLAGRMWPTNSPVGTIAYGFVLQGKDSTGIEALFHGEMLITNAPGRREITKTSDLTGVLLRGTFEVPGKLTNEIAQAFGP